MTNKVLIAYAITAGLTATPAIAAPATGPLEHFSAKAVEMTTPARITFRPIDIVITRWSTFQSHELLSTTLLQKGPSAFLGLLCNFEPAGAISVMGGRDIPIRYAWSIENRDGSRRVFVATDEPIVLAGVMSRRYSDAEPLTFLELRLNRNGEGEGKLSEVRRLSVDQSRSVIELREYADRPLHLVMVRTEPAD